MTAASVLFLHEYLRDVLLPSKLGLSPRTAERYRNSITALCRFAGRPLSLSDLTEELLARFCAALLVDHAAKTVRGRRGDLLAIWRFAAERGDVRQPGKVPIVRVPRRLPSAWHPEDVARILVACDHLEGWMRGTKIPLRLWWRALLTTAYWIGARVTALVGTKTCDVDLRRYLIRLPVETAKTKEEQLLRLSPQAAESIALIYDSRRQYIWQYGWHPRKLWRDLRAILTEAGLPADRTSMFQKFRRTCYTLTYVYGGQAAARKQLGHKTDLSAYYLDPSFLDDVQAADVLPAIP